MSRQRRRDTAPEVALRRRLHAEGFRFRVAWPVPGLPRRTIDVAFTAARVAVFVDGCFWHGCPVHGTQPRTNADWWAAKIERNKTRDEATTRHLDELGWTVVRAWEHEQAGEAARRVAEVVRACRRPLMPSSAGAGQTDAGTGTSPEGTSRP